jgi:hypothetical protein
MRSNAGSSIPGKRVPNEVSLSTPSSVASQSRPAISSTPAAGGRRPRSRHRLAQRGPVVVERRIKRRRHSAAAEVRAGSARSPVLPMPWVPAAVQALARIDALAECDLDQAVRFLRSCPQSRHKAWCLEVAMLTISPPAQTTLPSAGGIAKGGLSSASARHQSEPSQFRSAGGQTVAYLNTDGDRSRRRSSAPCGQPFKTASGRLDEQVRAVEFVATIIGASGSFANLEPAPDWCIRLLLQSSIASAGCICFNRDDLYLSLFPLFALRAASRAFGQTGAPLPGRRIEDRRNPVVQAG